MKYYNFLDIPQGRFPLVWEGKEKPALLELLLPREGKTPEETAAAACPYAVYLPPEGIMKTHIAVLESWLSRGGNTPLPEFVRVSGNDFKRKVWFETCLIPSGRVSSYGALAARLGKAGASRAVGSALAANPLPLLIPCHRVVRAGGDPGRFGGGSRLKKNLLAAEGISFDAKGRIAGEFFR